MRCPKCHYISFDSSDRCRNCGYEFALAVDVEHLDLPIQTGEEAIGPLSDLKLTDLETPPPAAASAAPSRSGGASAASAAAAEARPITSSFDLPLFRDRGKGDDVPLVTLPAAPRAPVSVRRSSPAAGRTAARIQLEEPELDLEAPAVVEQPAQPAVLVETANEPSDAAPAGSRILAAIVDALILGAIFVVVLYLTLQVCGLGLAEAAVIPLAPFVSFLLLIAGGYFTLFVAANGQTIGKMAAGLKVVSADDDSPRVSLGHSVVRAVGYLVSALPAGLGFLPALLGADRRTIHDRLAATRVVKA